MWSCSRSHLAKGLPLVIGLLPCLLTLDNTSVKKCRDVTHSERFWHSETSSILSHCFYFPQRGNKNCESIALCAHPNLPHISTQRADGNQPILYGSTKTHNRNAFQPWPWTLTLARHARRRDSYNDALHSGFTTCGGPT